MVSGRHSVRIEKDPADVAFKDCQKYWISFKKKSNMVSGRRSNIEKDP